MENSKIEKRGRFRNLKDMWIRMRRNKLAMVGLIILVSLILVAIFADFIAPYGFAEQDLSNQFAKPSGKHFFGTDDLGRDIFSRVVYGSRISLKVGFISVGIALVVGTAIGAVTGYYGGKLDNALMRFIDILQSIPDTLLAIAILAALGAGLSNLMIAVGIASIPGYARIVRSSVLSIRDMEFIEAAKANGSSNFRIIMKHVIPNCMAPLIVQATLGVAYAIINAAGLSFIGLGLEPPTPEWGAMLSGGRTFIRDYPHMTIFPGIAIVTTIFALNVLGDGLRDALDPKLKR
ncbi:ABC transporter permease [Miniphocaeibacter massiliensis]|uniref:ABC transporter permease n=1 Tax=Miniphocaeibacter massiliensis TaxID=2041841 RepID=UPI001F5D25B9|nr:ABC transporter permease [Miniphocaeibacter massiliensis]